MTRSRIVRMIHSYNTKPRHNLKELRHFHRGESLICRRFVIWLYTFVPTYCPVVGKKNCKIILLHGTRIILKWKSPTKYSHNVNFTLRTNNLCQHIHTKPTFEAIIAATRRKSAWRNGKAVPPPQRENGNNYLERLLHGASPVWYR